MRESSYAILLHCCDNSVGDYYPVVDQAQKVMDVSGYTCLSLFIFKWNIVSGTGPLLYETLFPEK